MHEVFEHTSNDQIAIQDLALDLIGQNLVKDDSTKESIDKFTKSLEVCQLRQLLQTFIQTIQEPEFTRATLRTDNITYQTDKEAEADRTGGEKPCFLDTRFDTTKDGKTHGYQIKNELAVPLQYEDTITEDLFQGEVQKFPINKKTLLQPIQTLICFI